MLLLLLLLFQILTFFEIIPRIYDPGPRISGTEFDAKSIFAAFLLHNEKFFLTIQFTDFVYGPKAKQKSKKIETTN